MSELARDNWDEIFDAIKGYWPDQFAKKWSSFINKAWKDRLGSHTKESVLLALKLQYGEKPFFPRLTEIVMKSKPPTRLTVGGKIEPNEWTREDCDAHWLTIDTILANYSDDDLKQHRATEIKHDWRRALFANHNIESMLWRAIIHDRIMRKLEPHERDEEKEIPERMFGGNLGVHMAPEILATKDLI